MARYRKKPVVIEAMQYDGTETSISNIIHFSGQRSIRYEAGCLFIDTLEGRMRADKNDYIIKGIKDEIYPCKPDIFEATYEQVEGD